MTDSRDEQLVCAEKDAALAKALLAEFSDLHQRMLKATPAPTFGRTPRQAAKERAIEKTLERLNAMAQRPDDLKRMWRIQAEQEGRRLEKEDQQAQERKQAEALEALREEALIWIAKHCPDKKLGTDFYLANVIDFANQCAFDKAVKQLQSESTHYYVFAGDDNCDASCQGWDGVSRRCECGNRRVYWTKAYGHSFKTPCAQAEAD